MRETIIRFFTIQPLNEHPLIYWGLLVAWLILLGATMASIRVQPISLTMRWVWLVLVVLVPVVGMYLYLIRCLICADYSFMKFVFGPPAKAKEKFVAKK